MGIHVALNHKTSYQYDRQVALSPQVVRLRPAPHCRTPIFSYGLKVNPADHFINWQQDPQSNFLARLVFHQLTRQFSLEVDLVAEIATFNPFDFFLEPSAETFPFEYDPCLTQELRPYRETEPNGSRLSQFLSTVGRSRTRTIDFLVSLNRRLQQQVEYVIRMEPGVQTCEETLSLARGSCRDTGWLLVQVLRQLGLAARFVSGYLIQLVPDVKPLDGPAGPPEDFVDLHAWTEVYLPGAGWIGLDPTSGLLAGEGHLPLACSPNPESAAPVSGSVDECKVEFQYEMSIQRISESPRVSKPYTEKEWAEIEILGGQVDQELAAQDVRLTMGGEPTFVSIDDMDGDEWNAVAQGPDKRRLGAELLRRLREQFAPGALLHFGQGKWYPGESLPRWTFNCIWRRDGEPVWLESRLIADESQPCGHGPEEARQFMYTLAETLGVEPDFALPGYEDVWYYLWRERRLPVDVDPLQSQLENKEERERLASVFEQGLGAVIGYALPLRRNTGQSGTPWISGRWFLRRGHLFLVPGDSPMGFRLPLDSLPWIAAGDDSEIVGQDPFAERLPLPGHSQMFTEERSAPVRPQQPGKPWTGSDQAQTISDSTAAFQDPSSFPVRTALCVEPRNGVLHVFLAPVARLEHYLELVTAVEDTARRTGMPVLLEGYPPPQDPRLNALRVSPDPGVIEVNIHPAHSWRELISNTSILYEEARLTRLGTEKFLMDGRHVGTGGGNHVILGGPSAQDSPVLRRPDLLRSLLNYWHNHPSLSYLFSGLFLGPTSQHPRVDEARNDSLYELEIAFSQTRDFEQPAPWLVDRLFRNLLIDVTGNTHRAEFSIDKLYPPDRASQRLGLLELRSFEMPPHARMSLVQQLLLRSFVAWFWQVPYGKPLVRWGTGLHDRFMLPHFVQQDFEDVILDLQQAGYPFQLHWFAPHFEFRFPLYGTVSRGGIQLEVRQALEPWHVMGEERGSGGTVRNVDSSVERLQVRVFGMTNDRHLVSCNQRRLPLQPTGTVGEFVAGVRYRAWQPPSCLHPTVPIHSPLVFDILDTWSGRSVGGCIYHVAHPGGRNYETLPVNAYEAESRRLARFSAIGHTPGSLLIPPEERNDEFPLTLDLRRGRPVSV